MLTILVGAQPPVLVLIRLDGQQTSFTVVENGTSTGGGAAKPVSTRGRKRKTPPPTHDAGDQVSAAAGQFASFAGAVDAEQPQQQQTSSQYSLDPGMQAFNGGGEVDDGEHGDRSPGGHSASGAGGNSSRSVNPSKRAEQNRKAQRAFRERRDAYVLLRLFFRPKKPSNSNTFSFLLCSP